MLPGGRSWDNYTGTLSPLSNQSNLLEQQVPADDLRTPDVQMFLGFALEFVEWNLFVTTTSITKFITCDLFSNVF